MSLSLIVALIVGSGLYLTAGVGWARNELPRIWEWAYREFSYGEAVRIWTGGLFVFNVLAWPVILPAQVIWRGIMKIIDQSDPQRAERERQEREAEIARLEREDREWRNHQARMDAIEEARRKLPKDHSVRARFEASVNHYYGKLRRR